MAKTLSNTPPPPRKPKSKKLILIALAVLVLLGLGGGGYWYASSHGASDPGGSKKAAHKTPSKDTSPEAVLQLQSFVVNLADPNQGDFLRVSIALGLGKPLPAGGEGGPGKGSPLIPQVRDAILADLSTWKSNDLLALNGKKELKEQLLATLHKKVPELDVTDIYFTDFLIQQ